MLMLPPMNAKFAKKTHAKTNVAVNLKKLELDDKIIKITKQKQKMYSMSTLVSSCLLVHFCFNGSNNIIHTEYGMF